MKYKIQENEIREKGGIVTSDIGYPVLNIDTGEILYVIVNDAGDLCGEGDDLLVAVTSKSGFEFCFEDNGPFDIDEYYSRFVREMYNVVGYCYNKSEEYSSEIPLTKSLNFELIKTVLDFHKSKYSSEGEVIDQSGWIGETEN